MLFTLNIIIVLINILFFSGLCGFYFTYKSNFFAIIAVETIFLAININFLFFSIFLNSMQGLLFIFYIIIISAAEIVILLSFFILFFKRVLIFDFNESLRAIKW